MGVRAEESFKRAQRPRIDNFDGTTQYKPIFKWQEWMVWEFIEQQKLAYPALYDETFSRIGCIVCPFILHKNSKQKEISMQRYPQIWKVFEKTVKQWWIDKMQAEIKNNNYRYKTAEEYWRHYLNGFE